MNETNETNVIETAPNTTETNGAQHYIDAIRDLQKNSVSRDKYNKLEAENKQLLDTLVNGGTIEQVNVEPERTVVDLRKTIADSDKTKLSAYDFIKTSLELREKVMAESGDDIFAKDNSYEARAKADRTAAVYQECLDIAKGDKDLFQREFESRLIESPMAEIKNTNNKRRF